MDVRTIGIIGHFGGNETILDGQTIKTKILYEELNKAADWEIIKVDTYYKSRNPVKLFIDTVSCLKRTKNIIVLLSGNGMKFYFPLLSFCARVRHIRVFHDVIGGNLDSYIEKYPKFKKYLNSFQANWVETNSMKQKLEKQGINNCEVIPNFKRLNVVDVRVESFEEPYRFCIFSRVMKEKGVEDAINAVEAINHSEGRKVCILDIYGRIEENYKKAFKTLLSKTTDAINYKGTVPYNKSVEAIKDYYALLFPTYWHGEGFPGTIVDAFSAGIPVIGTDWNCNGEVIDNKRNGILYPNDEMKDLREAIEWLIDNRENMLQMKRNCIESAKKYQPELHIKEIVNEIECGA